MRVKIKYAAADSSERALTIKFKVPKKWRAGPVAKLKATFLETFNEKFSQHEPLDAGDCHLVAAQRVVRPTRPLTARRATVGDSRDSTLVAFQTPSKCAAEPDLGAFFAP